MSKFEAGLDGVVFTSHGSKLIGGFYKAVGETPRPTAILLHGLPGIEKHLDLGYGLRERGWNCLYFHFRGCWGSGGAYSLDGLADDTRAAVAWVRAQASVDPDRVVLIGASTGSHPAFSYGATDPRIRAIVGVSPVIDPSAFHFPEDMAAEFAEMLNGITADAMREQWLALDSLADSIRALAPRQALIVAAGRDPIFPATQYLKSISGLDHVHFVQRDDADHGFSLSRRWLVNVVTDWLITTVGQ